MGDSFRKCLSEDYYKQYIYIYGSGHLIAPHNMIKNREATTETAKVDFLPNIASPA